MAREPLGGERSVEWLTKPKLKKSGSSGLESLIMDKIQTNTENILLRKVLQLEAQVKRLEMLNQPAPLLSELDGTVILAGAEAADLNFNVLTRQCVHGKDRTLCKFCADFRATYQASTGVSVLDPVYSAYRDHQADHPEVDLSGTLAPGEYDHDPEYFEWCQRKQEDRDEEEAAFNLFPDNPEMWCPKCKSGPDCERHPRWCKPTYQPR